MPNTGRPSQDCHLCRSRRVKCDLEKPTCRRCFVYGVSCPGYRTETDRNFLVVSSEDIIKARTSKRARRKGQKPPETQTTTSKSDAAPRKIKSKKHRWGAESYDYLSQDQDGLGIPKSILGPHPQFAISLFLGQFSPAEPHVGNRPGRLGFFPDVYCDVEAKPESCLMAVMDAFAHACSALQSDRTFDATLLGKKYGKALRMTNKALAHPTESVEDSTIVAVWLLGWYEIQVASAPTASIGRFGATKNFHAHIHGVMTLLGLRGIKQLTSSRGKKIFWTMFGLIIVRWMNAGIKCPPECGVWLDCLLEHWPVNSEEDKQVIATSEFFRHLIESCDVESQINRLIDQARPYEAYDMFPLLEAAFDEVDAQNPPPAIDDGRHCADFDTIRDNYHCHSAKLRRHQAMVHLIDFIEDLAPSPSDFLALQLRKGSSTQVIAETVKIILEKIELDLGDRAMRWADLYTLVIPLSNLSRLMSVPDDLRVQSLALMQRMGREVGISRAMNAYCYVPEQSVGTYESDLSCRRIK